MNLDTNVKREDGIKQKAQRFGLPLVIIITVLALITAILLLRNFSEDSRNMLLTVFWVSFLATIAVYILMQDIRVLILTLGIVVMYVGVFKYHQTLMDQSYKNYTSITLENLNLTIIDEIDAFSAKVEIDDDENFYFWMRTFNSSGSNHPVAVIEHTHSTTIREVTLYGTQMSADKPVDLYFDTTTKCICISQDNEVCNALIHYDDGIYYEKLTEIEPNMKYLTTLMYNEDEKRWTTDTVF